MPYIPLARCQFLIPFADIHSTTGASTESLLEKFNLPAFLHGKEDSYVPIKKGIHFIESAARTQGIPDFGHLAAKHVGFEHWNENSRAAILNSPTLFYALRSVCGRSHIDATNLSMHLEFHGNSLRVCSRLHDTEGMQHLEHSQWLQNILPVEIVRLFADTSWAPETIAFEARYTPSLAVQGLWPKTRFLSNQKISWIDIPLQYLGLPPVVPEKLIHSAGMQVPDRSIQLVDSLKMMLPSYLDGKIPKINEIAEMANTSARSLQRMLAIAGLSYREIINITKFEKASQILKTTDIKIIDIALSLGYSDHAHFTRAFQKIAGISPLQFRVFNRARL